MASCYPLSCSGEKKSGGGRKKKKNLKQIKTKLKNTSKQQQKKLEKNKSVVARKTHSLNDNFDDFATKTGQ
jgi:ElaB/YqjD/DUF883 family membrane-anchored ribosome-binding protein